MITRVSISIDVADMKKALEFYTEALNWKFKIKYSDEWQVISITWLDIHLQQKDAWTIAAWKEKRDYKRHWTPIHIDFSVEDIKPICSAIEKAGGIIENTTFSSEADIANCVDPFGNGFCIIRE